MEIEQNTMKLATIYNVFSDSLDFLEQSINSIEHVADHIIIVYSNYSNSGEYKECILPEFNNPNIRLLNVDKLCSVPKRGYKQISQCERNKRQIGVDYAKSLGCTHFLLMDSDELYDKEEIANAWYIVSINPDFDATYVRMYTYFMTTDLRLKEKESYAVPFICKLHKDLKLEEAKWGMFVDPTRCYKTNNNRLFEGITMHHYSWVRSNLKDKIKYSTANMVIQKRMKDLKWDIANAVKERYSKFYNMELVKVKSPMQ